MTRTTLSPPNAIVFVMDLTNPDVRIPEYVNGRLVASTESCVSVGTQAEVDGKTTVVLVKSIADSNALEKHIFQGKISTPGKKIAVVTSDLRKILEVNVAGDETLVNIWVDHNRNPSNVVISAR